MRSPYDAEIVQIRLKHVLPVRDREKSISQAARDAEVDWKTMKNWIVRFEEEGIQGLLNKPRGGSNPVTEQERKLIVKLKTKNRHRSARKIRDLLAKDHDIRLNRQTIWRVLKSAGENKRARRKHKVYHDFERQHPNSLWQIDYMDAIVVQGVGPVFLVLIIDDHSRKIIGGRFVPDRTAYRALSVLRESVETHGIPSQIYSDQGKQFKSHLGRDFTHFERVCKRLGIETIFGTPNYPEGRGKIERLFGFIQDDFIPEYRFTDLEDMNQKFSEWMEWYCTEHEHSSLGGNPPDSRYCDFIPRMPEGDMFEIFSEHFQRKVRKNATISFKGKIYPLDPRYIRDKVEVRAFGDEIRIYAQSVLLGEFDARIDYHEKMLRRVYTRIVKTDGTIKFKNVRYPMGEEFVGRRVEILVIRDQLRAFLSSSKLVIFKLGDSDAMVVKLDR
jgi:transposase InsO family protein